MSLRVLQRQFADVTAVSAYEWIIPERVALAQKMLEPGHAELAASECQRF